MWWTPKERHDLRRDPEKSRIVKEYREEVADCTDTVIVPRRKFHCRQPASPYQQCAADTVTDTSAAEHCEAPTMPETSATESPASPPAEVNEVGESERNIVAKGAKTETDQSPPRIIASKPTINQTPANPEIDVDAQLERIFAAVASGGPFTTAQARVIKREVARLRQLKRQQKANAVTDTPAPEQLVLTTAELTRVGEFKWTRVKKGVKAEPDRKPPPISSSNQFSALAPPANKKTDRPCDPSPTEPIQPQETAIKAAVAVAAGRGDGKKLNHELKRILKETKRAKQKVNDRQQVELAAARRAGRVARHLKRNEAEKSKSETQVLKTLRNAEFLCAVRPLIR